MRIALLLCLAAACGKGDGAAPAPGSAGGADPASAEDTSGPRQAVLDAWKTGKLAPSAFTPATVAVGKDCRTGTVNGVDVLVCAYAAQADAKAAESAAYAWIGDTTGMVQSRNAVLVAAADRRKADPSGRTINQLMKLAPK